jgi:hypothetical protein
MPLIGEGWMQVLVAESLNGITWAHPFAVPRGTGSRVDRPRATVFFEPVHMVRTRFQHSHNTQLHVCQSGLLSPRMEQR